MVALASSLRGRASASVEAVAQNPFDAVTREDAGLLRDLAIGADVDASADARVLAFGVFADAHHVDVRRAAIGQRRRQSRQQPHRPQVHVLLEALANGENQRRRRAVGNAWRADRAEIDRIERRQALEAVGVHHPAVLFVELAAPGKLGERERHVAAARGGLERGDAGRNDFAADAVAGDDRDLERL